MSQAFIYLAITFTNINYKLRVASFVTFILYGLIGINWLLFQRSIEIEMQTYFYNHFSSIITTLNLIVIYLLGKNGAIHIFNTILRHLNFLNKIQLRFGNTSNNSVYGFNLPVSNKNIKGEEVSK